jgi:hypothetical protein
MRIGPRRRAVAAPVRYLGGGLIVPSGAGTAA